jgi:hypothetical protein
MTDSGVVARRDEHPKPRNVFAMWRRHLTHFVAAGRDLSY